jgi:DnaK suppressor protein
MLGDTILSPGLPGADIFADDAGLSLPWGGVIRRRLSGRTLSRVTRKVQAMSKDQGISDTDGIRHRLLAERTELLSRATPLTMTNPLAPDERDSDEADAAVTTDMRERAMWLLQDHRKKLELIEQALQRIANGSYGRCEKCGGSIDPERLSALPYATQCIRCQEQAERPHRRARGGRDAAKR